MNSTANTTKNGHENGNIITGDNPIHFSLADPLPLFIVQSVIILSACHILNLGLRRIRQPKVVSEVIAGIILGPSIMGKIPGFTHNIFPPESLPFLTLVANLGLVLFLFLVGLELDPALILKRAKHAIGISVAGLVIPFALSCGASTLLYKMFEESGDTPPPPYIQFLLVCCMCMSLTAFPILARILAEMQLMSTSVGFLTVCAAAVGDIVAWIMLALIVSLINATTPIMPLYVVLMAVGVCLFLAYVVRPSLLYLVRVTHSEEEPTPTMIAITLMVVLSCAFITHVIGIHSIFGGFLIGLMLPHDSGFAEGLTRRIEDLVGVYLLPIFFTCSGFKTDVGLLNNGETWGMVFLVVAIAASGKLLGCSVAAKLNGMTWRESLAIGFLMNCKGLVEYVILNIGHDAGVVGDRVFVILVAMCVFLTMIATPFVGYLYPTWYQKELQVKREAERKLQEAQAARTKNKQDSSSSHSTQRRGLFSGLFRRRRRGGDVAAAHDDSGKAFDDGAQDNYEDLDGIRVSSSEDERTEGRESVPKKDAIMLCIDKSANAPGVMTLLQLFSGTSTHRRPPSKNHNHSNGHDSHPAHSDGAGVGQSNPQRDTGAFQGILQPSIDISDPQGKRRTDSSKNSSPTHAINYSAIYAIRLLQISERTSAALLTASRCMDRLYKDTVMMMVMAFAKLNSIPLRPLVAMSPDSAQSTVAMDILNRAVDLSVRWVVFPWNSSHLVDLPLPSAGLTPSGGQTMPGVTLTVANTSTTGISVVSTPGAHMTHDGHESARQFPYNISRYFDHDQSRKIASGGHQDLTESGQVHRTSIASNTKVLSKLIPACAAASISTAVMVDRGLGLYGGIEHIVVPLLGGDDDEEALSLASCLARSTPCFVTLLRISTQQSAREGQSYPFLSQQHLAPHGLQFPIDLSVPPTPDGVGRPPQYQGMRMSEDSTHVRPTPPIMVPKDENTLFQTYFPTKPKFLGEQFRHRQQVLQRKRTMERTATAASAAGYPLGRLENDDDDFPDMSMNKLEEGIMALDFIELSDAIQWVLSSLTPQDMLVVGYDSEVSLSQGTTGYHGYANSQRPLSSVFSPPSEESRLPEEHTSSPPPPSLTLYPTSPRSILERRGLNLSPRSEASGAHHAPSVTIDLPSDEEKTGMTASDPSGASPGGRSRFSRHRRGVSIRSQSRGRKQRQHVDTPGLSGPAFPSHLAASSMTTCQMMIGLVADQMIQSGVGASLLVVRSRSLFQRKVKVQLEDSMMSSPGSGLALPTVSMHISGTNMSHQSSLHRGVVFERTWQYHTQQQAHHSRLSQDLDAMSKEEGQGPSSARVTQEDKDDSFVTPRVSES